MLLTRLKMENQILGQAVETLKKKHESVKRDLDIANRRIKDLEVYVASLHLQQYVPVRFFNLVE